VETPAEIERFFDVTSHTGVGLCLDTGHSLYGAANPVAEAEKYRGILRFIHIKDCDANVLEEARRKEHTFDQAIEEKVFTIIGRGSIDFPAFFRVLQKNGYSGWMVVEQDVKFGATPIPPSQSIAASLRYLRGVVNGLGAAVSR
jgi:inosose dehydratase